MRKPSGFILGAVLIFFFVTTLPAQAVDLWYELPVARALDSSLAREKLLPGIRIFLQGQEHPVVVRNLGEFKSNKRGNAFGRSREQACEIAFISAVISLQERAVNEGGNGVIDIYALTKYRRVENQANFNCLAGSMIANVVLKGTVVQLE